MYSELVTIIITCEDGHLCTAETKYAHLLRAQVGPCVGQTNGIAEYTSLSETRPSIKNLAVTDGRFQQFVFNSCYV